MIHVCQCLVHLPRIFLSLSPYPWLWLQYLTSRSLKRVQVVKNLVFYVKLGQTIYFNGSDRQACYELHERTLQKGTGSHLNKPRFAVTLEHQLVFLTSFSRYAMMRDFPLLLKLTASAWLFDVALEDRSTGTCGFYGFNTSRWIGLNLELRVWS